MRTVVYGAAIVAPWFSRLPLPARLILSLLVALYACHALSGLWPGRRVRGLMLDGRGWRLAVGTTMLVARDLRVICCTEWLVLLACTIHCARPSGQMGSLRRTRLVWILPDSLSPAQHSALRRHIRLGVDTG